MALPQASDMNKYDGKKFTNTDWDGNVDATVSFLSSGNYDLKVGDIDCAAINAESINLPIQAGVPTGTLIPFVGTEVKIPEGYIIPEGQNLDIATYEELFYVCAGTYGLGDATKWYGGGPNATITGTPWECTDITNDIATIVHDPTLVVDVGEYVAIHGEFDNNLVDWRGRGYKVLEVPVAGTIKISVAGALAPTIEPNPEEQNIITKMTTFTVPDLRYQTQLTGPTGFAMGGNYGPSPVMNINYTGSGTIQEQGYGQRNQMNKGGMVFSTVVPTLRPGGIGYRWTYAYGYDGTRVNGQVDIDTDDNYRIEYVSQGELLSVNYIMKT